jgi:transposase-like protein
MASGSLIDELKKVRPKRRLNTKLDVHLSDAAANHRNGSSAKTVLTDGGALPLSIPRDRHGRFEPLANCQVPAPLSKAWMTSSSRGIPRS